MLAALVMFAMPVAAMLAAERAGIAVPSRAKAGPGTSVAAAAAARTAGLCRRER